MSHREPLRVDHATGEAVLRQALEGKTARPHPHSALIALCLHDDDRAFVEGWCIRLGRAAPDPGMRMVAALGISYLACRFRTIGPEAAELVRTLATDQTLGESPSRVVGDALRRLERCTPPVMPRGRGRRGTGAAGRCRPLAPPEPPGSARLCDARDPNGSTDSLAGAPHRRRWRSWEISPNPSVPDALSEHQGGSDALKWPHCDGLNWPHLVSDGRLTVRGSSSSSGRRQREWDPGWSSSSRSDGTVIVRACRCGRSRSGMGFIAGR
jgi:hypothetical protein